MQKIKNHSYYSFWFYALVIYHFIAWTLIPTLVRSALPIDSMEGTTWGRQLELGYDKNPYLNAWVTELAIKIGGQHDWIIYAFAQLAIIISFWAIWSLGKKFLPTIYVLVAVYLLEGMQYFNFAGIDLNDNLLELPLWSLIMLFFYKATKEQRLLDWFLVGLFAGLAMMDKYFAVILFFPMLLFTLFNAEARLSWKKPGIYLAAFIFSVVTIPHIYWLFHHDFITINYALHRVDHPAIWQSHISGPLYFGLMQIATFIPALLLFGVLWVGKASEPRISPTFLMADFDKKYLLYMGVGPFITTILLSIVTGFTLHIMWGTPLLIGWSLVLVAWLPPFITASRFKWFLTAVFGFVTLTLLIFAWVYSKPTPTKGHFPAKQISKTLTQLWHERYHTPLNYVAGHRYIAGGLSFYSEDRPAVFIDWDQSVSPWINETDVKIKGAVFVIPVDGDHPDFPVEVKNRFPNMQVLPVMTFAWNAKGKLAPLQIRVAILPPKR